VSLSGQAATWADGHHPDDIILPQTIQQSTTKLKHIAIDGHLSGILPEAADGLQQVSFGCCFLTEGRFAFRAVVYPEIQDNGTPRVAWFSNELSLQVQ
jgi:hypothetical protein